MHGKSLNKFWSKSATHGRLRAITTDTSNSPFSMGISECEFSKFMILTFDCYSIQSNWSSIFAKIRTRWWSILGV